MPSSALGVRGRARFCLPVKLGLYFPPVAFLFVCSSPPSLRVAFSSHVQLMHTGATLRNSRKKPAFPEELPPPPIRKRSASQPPERTPIAKRRKTGQLTNMYVIGPLNHMTPLTPASTFVSPLFMPSSLVCRLLLPLNIIADELAIRSPRVVPLLRPFMRIRGRRNSILELWCMHSLLTTVHSDVPVSRIFW